MNIYAVSVKKPNGNVYVKLMKGDSAKKVRKYVLGKLQGTNIKLRHINYVMEEPYCESEKKVKKVLHK